MPRFIDVDFFAGGGGASLGIEAALGKPVDIAIDHDPETIAVHAADHPRTLHSKRRRWHDTCGPAVRRLGWYDIQNRVRIFNRELGVEPGDRCGTPHAFERFLLCLRGRAVRRCRESLSAGRKQRQRVPVIDRHGREVQLARVGHRFARRRNTVGSSSQAP